MSQIGLFGKLGSFTCRECGKDFQGYYTNNRLVICSEKCRSIRSARADKEKGARYRAKRYHPPQPRDCANCNLVFTPGGSRADARFCSLKCGNRGRQIERIYNIKIEYFHELYLMQKGNCAGCLLPLKGSTPYVDHDHSNGRVRGLLHGTCNSILGFVDDDSVKLENLVKYLRKEI